ncbi:MAG: iron-containing alcohol dehydrogenase [Parvularculaceae bacterium]|nr:iron-containing alcohol dehydrogenase [Parvularculaceae bacterium]
MPRLYMFWNVLLEEGALNKLPEEVARLGMERPLLVTDPGLAGLGLADRCVSLCAALTVFDQTPENPTEASVLQAVDLYKEKGCDGIVALGGGSSMDLGKAVSILVSHEGKLGEFDITGPDPRPIGSVPPILVIPTTSGTGTEVAFGCVITLESGQKSIIDSERLVPAAVICDPELTVSLPARLTAATGIDALSHCIEGYCSNISNPLTEPIALDGIHRIAHAIERAVHEPGDIAARRDMMIGSLQGGLAMSMELGAAHGLSVPLGAYFHGHHGELTGAVLGTAMSFNEPAQPETMANVRQALGVPDGADLRDWMNTLCEGLGLRTSLEALGAKADLLPEIANEASGSFFDSTNFRAGSPDDYLEMLRAQF